MPRHHRHQYLAIFAKVLHTHHAHTTGTARTPPYTPLIKVRNRVVSVVSLVSVPAAQGFLARHHSDTTVPIGEEWCLSEAQKRVTLLSINAWI